jgi:hypothetical protein
MYDILIPSNRGIGELRMMVRAIRETDSTQHNYITSGFQVGASVNRNYCLLKAKSDTVIMMDDDIGGFFQCWQDVLVEPLSRDKTIKLVSARLMTPQGALSPMMGCDNDLSKSVGVANTAILSACIAFRLEDMNNIWFDERFVGSGFEDTDVCFQLKKKYPDCKFVVNNECQLVHFHEMKNQTGEYFKTNRALFVKKWGANALRGMVPDA